MTAAPLHMTAACSASVGSVNFSDTASVPSSVKRLCVDKKITPPERDALPAIYAGDRLAAVWRLGTDVSFLPQSEEDARFVRIVPL